MISLNCISKSYDNNLIIDNLSYTFRDSGIYHIKGESGVGKTTLLRIIAGLEKLDTGTAVLPERVSFAFQEYRLFPWLNLIDNVLVGAYDNASWEQVKEAKALLNRLGFADNDLKKYPSELSGGMKQRVSLARAFLFDSNVLILDEPTKELDEELVTEVFNIISEQSKNKLVLLTTHQPLPNNFPLTAILSLSRPQE